MLNSFPPDYANSLPTANSTTYTRRSHQSLCNIVFQNTYDSLLFEKARCLTKACILESSETQAAGMEEKLTAHRPEEDISFVKGHYKKCPNSHICICDNTQSHTKSPGKSLHFHTCRKCEKNPPHKESPCPTQGCMCKKCGKPTHFSKIFRTVVIPK